MNVMLTCAGRRTQTVEMFRLAVAGRGRVLACDCSPDAPALRAADEAFVVPPVDDPRYLDALLALCDAHGVGLLVPAFEPELPLLAEHRARFAAIGTLALVSSPEVVATCYDKIESERFLAANGLAIPRTYASLGEARDALARGEISFPLVVKPRWGVGSIALAFPEDDDELELAYRLAHKQLGRSFLAAVSASDPARCVLVQENLAGDEYGLDIVNDLGGRHVATLVKRKLRMRSGQTDRATTVRDERLETLGARIGRRLRHVGILDCDAFVVGDECYAIDLNPRMGGGYPYSHLAGADVPAALVAWARGDVPPASCFRIASGVTVSRGDTFVVTERPSAVLEIGFSHDTTGAQSPCT